MSYRLFLSDQRAFRPWTILYFVKVKTPFSYDICSSFYQEMRFRVVVQEICFILFYREVRFRVVGQVIRFLLFYRKVRFRVVDQVLSFLQSVNKRIFL